MWTYPDGTKSSRRPRDGEIFEIIDHYTGSVESRWQWDAVPETWFNISSGKYNKANTATHAVPNLAPPPASFHYDPAGLYGMGHWMDPDLDANVELPPVHADKPKNTTGCQCGGWSVKATKHPYYCPLFVKES